MKNQPEATVKVERKKELVVCFGCKRNRFYEIME